MLAGGAAAPGTQQQERVGQVRWAGFCHGAGGMRCTGLAAFAFLADLSALCTC